jgi:endonuclease/exonuclease/phosphatase family metal-dependent hydrolase
VFGPPERAAQSHTRRRALLAACCGLLAIAAAVLAAPAPALAVPAQTRAITWNLCGSVCWPLGAEGSQYPNVDFRGETAIRAKKVAKAVAAHGATVLFTQETCAGQYSAILKALGTGWYGSFKRTNNSGNCRNGSDKVGLAIFTKGRHTNYRYTLLGSDEERNWFMVCVTWSGVDLCNLHLRAFVTEEEKGEQTAIAFDAVGWGPGPTVIAGDFNQVPTAPGLFLLQAAGFREVDELQNEPTSPDSEYKIDYIFVKGARAVDGDSASYGPGSISDHRMLRGWIYWR